MNSSVASHMAGLAYAYGQPQCHGAYKVTPEDFVVEERIAFELSGEGEHLWCWVEKRGENTDWVARQLAQWAGVPVSRVGVAGQKDRHAVTRQWFSIQLPGKQDPEIAAFDHENACILKCVRHQRKLQRGGLSGNRFEITLRQLSGDCADLEQRLFAIQQGGVPNYFGEQRFGRNENNLRQAGALFSGELKRVKRTQRSLIISAVRSWFFNRVLSQRIEQACWNQFLPGDVLQLTGSTRWFADDGSDDLAERVASGDLSPTGPLPGQGDSPSKNRAGALEASVLQERPEWLTGLEKLGLKQDRRALVLRPGDFNWEWLKSDEFNECHPDLKLCFSLPSGSFATAVIRELIQTQ
ncbi:tRNA pseudouridine(13) synthase TruD [Thiomicrorhabdus sp. zzn3]|uniref:tRNA pseudouridine(13) synthase TruD n=1 Tax=Thiomicrorhabdus sp. zzn3 TaxID=3039775 RepID=UPI002436427E|nr:tRNA pseudouridine(13) synthase TruD [Thiomicrorhabdus sp. zzn3]MDG6778968.1 tRNA pseudouridine(13) synthase TruD [Thiomicrorhabdus sp. zzn3]